MRPVPKENPREQSACKTLREEEAEEGRVITIDSRVQKILDVYVVVENHEDRVGSSKYMDGIPKPDQGVYRFKQISRHMRLSPTMWNVVHLKPFSSHVCTFQ